MAEKRAVRFGKWLIKVAISYMVFIGIGWLLGRIPAGRFGLPEEMLLNLRMFLMLSLIHISEPTRQAEISYAVFCLKKKKRKKKKKKYA